MSKAWFPAPMISLTPINRNTARVRVAPGHDATIPWGPALDPWRVMFLATRGVLLGMTRDYLTDPRRTGRPRKR